MNNEHYFWLALLGQTTLIIGCYIFLFQQVRELIKTREDMRNHIITAMENMEKRMMAAFEKERDKDSATHKDIYDKIGVLRETLGYTKGKVNQRKGQE